MAHLPCRLMPPRSQRPALPLGRPRAELSRSAPSLALHRIGLDSRVHRVAPRLQDAGKSVRLRCASALGSSASSALRSLTPVSRPHLGRALQLWQRVRAAGATSTSLVGGAFGKGMQSLQVYSQPGHRRGASGSSTECAQGAMHSHVAASCYELCGPVRKRAATHSCALSLSLVALFIGATR